MPSCLQHGAAIEAVSGTVAIYDCVFSNNHCEGYGGAIMVNAGGTALIYGSVFTYNGTPQVCLPAAPLAARSLQRCATL